MINSIPWAEVVGYDSGSGLLYWLVRCNDCIAVGAPVGSLRKDGYRKLKYRYKEYL